MHRITRERGWEPARWRRLPRRDKVSLLAYDYRRNEQRRNIKKGLNEQSMSFQSDQVAILLDGL